MLGRPVDVLGATRLDFYAFTHVVMYASDLGERRVRLPRPSAAVAADAEAALAYSLDTNDFDLAAEAVLTWPMLNCWSPAATFAFGLLAAVEDRFGFLPGLGFYPAHYQGLTGRAVHALATSYHTVYVMGFLCAATLREGRAPPATVPPARRATGAGGAILRLLDADSPAAVPERAVPAPRSPPAGRGRFPGARDRAASGADEGRLRRVRRALEVALAHGLGGPAPMQAAALLRRAGTLNKLLGRKATAPSDDQAATPAQRKNSAGHEREERQQHGADHSM